MMDSRAEEKVPEIDSKVETIEWANRDASAAESPEFRAKEAKLVRKLDLALMLISYLDRGNIGFAATQGLAKDIGLKGSQLNVS